MQYLIIFHELPRSENPSPPKDVTEKFPPEGARCSETRGIVLVGSFLVRQSLHLEGRGL